MKIDHGVCVYSTDGGTTWQQGLYPFQSSLQTSDAVTGAANTRQEGVDYFLGGHVYLITQAQATALTAAGFGAYISSPTGYSDEYESTYS